MTLLGGPLGYTPRAGTPPSALDWLLRADEETESIETWYQATEEKKKNLAGCEHRETLRNLQLKHPSLITISDPPVPRGTTWASRNRPSQSMDTRAAPVLNLQAWHLTSFSQLAHGHHQERERRDAVLTEPEISDIETTREPGQAPTIQLHGRSKELAAERGISRWHLTITHDAGLALAFVVAESDG